MKSSYRCQPLEYISGVSGRSRVVHSKVRGGLGTAADLNGTDGSNPAPSSAESVSAVNSSAVGREPRGFAALCAYAGT